MKEFGNNNIGKLLFATILVSIFLALFVNVFALPKACNRNPKSSIMKLESQVQKFTSKIDTKIEDWMNSDDTFAIISKYFLGFVFAVFMYFFHDFMMKAVPLPTLNFYTLYSGFCWLGAMVARDYIFQDSNNRCKMELTLGIGIYQTFGLASLAILIFIKLQHFLSKMMNLNWNKFTDFWLNHNQSEKAFRPFKRSPGLDWHNVCNTYTCSVSIMIFNQLSFKQLNWCDVWFDYVRK